MKKRIIGIDPGTCVTGYGIIEKEGNSYTVVDYGCIKPPAKLKLTERYLIISNGLSDLLQTYKPSILSVETQYVQKNVQSAIKLGMARGVIILTALQKGLEVFEYTPSRAKKAIVGNGNASKQQVQWMLTHLLSLTSPPTPEDASDALSLALCHALQNKLEVSN